MSVTLKPGDLVFWTGDEDHAGAPLLVAENGIDLLFQFGQKPWHIQDLRNGKTVAELENILNGRVEWMGPGHLYKCFDAETDRALGDPRLAE